MSAVNNNPGSSITQSIHGGTVNDIDASTEIAPPQDGGSENVIVQTLDKSLSMSMQSGAINSLSNPQPPEPSLAGNWADIMMKVSELLAKLGVITSNASVEKVENEKEKLVSLYAYGASALQQGLGLFQHSSLLQDADAMKQCVDAALKQAESKLSDAQKRVNDAEKKLNQLLDKYKDAGTPEPQELRDARTELATAKSALAGAQTDVNTLKNLQKEAKGLLDDAGNSLDAAKTIIEKLKELAKKACQLVGLDFETTFQSMTGDAGGKLLTDAIDLIRSALGAIDNIDIDHDKTDLRVTLVKLLAKLVKALEEVEETVLSAKDTLDAALKKVGNDQEDPDERIFTNQNM